MMSTSLLDRNTGYPDLFYNDLDVLNDKKNSSAPVALILKADTLETSPGDMARTIQIADKHRIVLQKWGHDHSIRQNIDRAISKTGQFPTKLVFLAHGLNASSIVLDDEESESLTTLHLYSRESVRPKDFFWLDSKAQIFLLTCGSGSGGLDSLAQRIADVSHRTVFAPKGELLGGATCFWEYPNGKWKMVSYLPGGGVQSVYKFRYNRIPKISSKKTLGEALAASKDKKNILGLFEAYADSMERYVPFANAKCQIIMSEYCRKGIPGCLPEDSIHWLLSAAEEENDPDAQYLLGCMYSEYFKWETHVEKSPENAFYWFKLAADQGHQRAQLQAAMCLENGEGCEQSEAQAVHYFQLAADQGCPEALGKVGVYSFHGRGGLPKSNQCALFYFGLALQQGFEPAREAFDLLSALEEAL